ncbi:(2Fe-2S) ferredoxin domain-containing protein [Microbacterium esteraromaticum]|uniref:(2Fe-2S) ferredoxin domain-containing protein n=1 Tax=Microbacterium esteraromaticum TaxID=57043 RepID=UPI001A8CC9DB|nr:(2Fe-2S) ferredoxin domain-containing protein [Microbacterium esteraromaticum]MBN8424367.1 (2Fe-2S) ferredoxin domain-containing protein [Microbacterium esteraromaticum]
MATKKQRRGLTVPHDRMTVVVCRGGDCGSRIKHPDTDHAAQLAKVRNAAGDQSVVTVSRCLDACEHSNVIVLVPDADSENAGATPVWVGEVNDAEVTADILEVMDHPGDLPDVPVVVELHTFRPTRQSRRELDGEIG